MASNEITAALSFLTDAGHLLATTAPETSAYIMGRRSNLMFEHELPQQEKQKQRVCSCCGHIMLLGQGSNLQVRPEKRANRKHRSTRLPKGKAVQPRQSGPTKAITCGLCAKWTEVKLPAPGPVSRSNMKMQKHIKPSPSAPGAALPLSNPSQEAPSQKTSSNASSKKRAKNRKAGLQALLDQSNGARGSRPGLGLSLADFMERK